MRTKMVIAVRKDLKMSRDMEMAQASHAALKIFFDRMEIQNHKVEGVEYVINTRTGLTPEMIEWKEDAYTKVVVSVNSEEEVYDLVAKAKEANIPYAVIIDNGFTEFAGRKTTTCIAIGPDENDKIDLITGDLKLR